MQSSGNRPHRLAGAALACVFAGTLAACANTPPASAPVASKRPDSHLAARPVPPMPAPDTPTAHEHVVTVARGQTLYDIARANHVPFAALADANHLKPPYMLLIGATVRVPDAAPPHDRTAAAVPATHVSSAPPRRPAPFDAQATQTAVVPPPSVVRVLPDIVPTAGPPAQPAAVQPASVLPPRNPAAALPLPGETPQ